MTYERRRAHRPDPCARLLDTALELLRQLVETGATENTIPEALAFLAKYDVATCYKCRWEGRTGDLASHPCTGFPSGAEESAC